jgi:hypothetical protein
MSRMLLVLVASFTIIFASLSASFDVKAADARVSPSHASYGRYCQDIWRVGPDGGKWYHVCTSGCPDGYSCAPLYGAYGPYGGQKYWGAYSDSGWSSYR